MRISQSKNSGRIVHYFGIIRDIKISKNPNEKRDQQAGDNEDLDDMLRKSSAANNDVRVRHLETKISNST